MPTEADIQSVTFAAEGLTITYLHQDDIRLKGDVVRACQLTVASKEYADDIESLYRKVGRLLDDVLEDFEESEPFTPEIDDDEDGVGMGDHR